ncbi:MAG: hypothetical protein PHU68_12595 [Paludibacter sp.]|nr:hypothetical protein [Paludibacter sp.]
MMKSFRHLRNRWVQLHFLLLFVVFYAGINFFPHTHTIDGKSYVHSHPFSESNSHQHTSAEFTVLSVLAHSSLLKTCISYLPVAYGLLLAIFRIKGSTEPISFYFHNRLFLRPPPVKMVF